MRLASSCSVTIWNRSCSGILIVSTIARWIESEIARRYSGLLPLRRATRTSGMPMRCRCFAPGSGLRAQVEGLAAGERQEPVLRERHAFAGILHAGPRQHRVEIVAAVHEERPGLDLRPDAEGALLVARPNRR